MIWFVVEFPDGRVIVEHLSMVTVGFVEDYKARCRKVGLRVLAVARLKRTQS
jgi:hypothetical protein